MIRKTLIYTNNILTLPTVHLHVNERAGLLKQKVGLRTVTTVDNSVLADHVTIKRS